MANFFFISEISSIKRDNVDQHVQTLNNVSFSNVSETIRTKLHSPPGVETFPLPIFYFYLYPTNLGGKLVNLKWQHR